MFRSERFIGRLARLSYSQASKWMILAFFGTLGGLGYVLGSFVGLFYTLQVSTPWLLIYLTCAGFLMWKAAFHTVLPSPALERITGMVDHTHITGEGIAHRIFRDMYSRGSLFGYYQALMNILTLFWVVSFSHHPLPIISFVLWGVLCVIGATLFQWHPLTFWCCMIAKAAGDGSTQTLETAVFDVPYDEPTDTEESSVSEEA